MSNLVYVVHCIDTEGPLYESLESTFERIELVYGLRFEPNETTLRQLQRGEIDLGGKEVAVQQMLDPRMLAYNETWDAIDAMLEDALSPFFRKKMADSVGNGWIYNWFCLDNVAYELNPHRRDIGYHNIFDHYTRVLRATASDKDAIHFHFHPHADMSRTHAGGNWWACSDTLGQVISRRVIDRSWFPAANRPNLPVNRAANHWFLEQYIPFDFSNQAVEPPEIDQVQGNINDKRYGNWRRAPRTWVPYHPAHDDYQSIGQCRRWIARCLNVGVPHQLLTEDEVRLAFIEARDGKPVVLAFAHHDYRDIRPDIDLVRGMLDSVSYDYPEVQFVYSEAISAMRGALNLPDIPACDLELTVEQLDGGDHLLHVRSETPTFGPQPWLAIKTTSGSYQFDTFDIQLPFHEWTYTFDVETFPWRAVEKIGVAANNAIGISTVAVFDPQTGETSRKIMNHAMQLQPA